MEISGDIMCSRGPTGLKISDWSICGPERTLGPRKGGGVIFYPLGVKKLCG